MIVCSNFEDAVEAYEAALRLDPDNKVIQNLRDEAAKRAKAKELIKLGKEELKEKKVWILYVASFAFSSVHGPHYLERGRSNQPFLVPDRPVVCNGSADICRRTQIGSQEQKTEETVRDTPCAVVGSFFLS